MCVNIEIVLPTIETFLLLYSLRSGCITILIWTLLRSMFTVMFFIFAILELLVRESPPFGAWLVRNDYQVPENLTLLLFYCFIILVMCDTTLIIFTNFLGYGIYFERSNLIKYYLICRFFTWVIEVLFISVLCLSHKYLIGYYLSILLFIVLEFYSFIVVYSYFVVIYEQEQDTGCKSCPDEAQELRQQISFNPGCQ